MTDFPNNPTLNQEFTAMGRTWRWNGTAWQAMTSSHTHPLSDLTQSGATTGQVPSWNGTAWVPQTPSGGGGTPSAHASTHATGGSDPITPAAIGAATAAQGAKADTALQSGAAISTISGLQTALDGKQASGNYATLVGGLVPASQLPSYVDDVIEAANFASLPNPGEAGKIYVADGKIYRWSGSAMVEISPSPGSTDAVPEGTTNLYHTTARASAAAPVQSVAGRTGTVTLAKGDVGLGNVDNTSDANKPVSTATQTALDGKAATSHAHGNITNAGAIGTTAALPVITGNAGVLQAGSFGTTAGTFAAGDHNHDGRYYTETETDALLATKQAAGSYAPASGIAPSAITGTAVITTDTRLSDSRTPTAHKSTHATGGADALTPADIGAEPAITTLPINKGGTGATTAEAARTALGALSPQIDRFATPGTYTNGWTKPAGAKQVLFECVGGGGGGGRGILVASGTAVSGGAGGGSGGYTRTLVNAVDLTDATYTIVVGSGGIGGTQPSGSAGAGTASNVSGATLGIFANATGGSGGNAGAGLGVAGAAAGLPSGNSGGAGSITANGGGGTGVNPSNSSGGAGGGCGTPSGSTTFQPFNGGTSGTNGNTAQQAIAGTASTTGNGTNGGTTTPRAIPSLVINGSGGGGGGATTFSGASGGNGGNASGFGGGGGGGGSVSAASGTGGNGGAGSGGIVMITTYF